VQPDGGYDQSNIPLVTAALGTTGLYVTPHVYYGGTDPNGAATWVQEQITGAQQNGLFPVIDEFGDALNGYIKDQYGQDVITSVIAANNAGKAGAAFWGMDNNNHQDGADSAFLTPDGSQLTSDGIEIQPWLSQTTGLLTTPVPPVTPSTNDTVILADDTSAITDANGNKWTITNGGQVALNGTVDATTRNVTEMAYVNGKVWQENTDKLWYSKTTPNDTWTPGTSTSPLPPTFTPSPNDTTIQPIPTPTITDNSGNIWAITTGGQVSVNGVVDTRTANVTEMAFVNGKVWQENASKLWYSEATPNGTWTTGTSTSPLPVPQIGPAIGTTGPGPAIQSVLQTNAMSINDFTPAVTTGVNTTGGGSTATTVPEQTIPGIYYSAPTTTSMDNILPTSHSTI
jgi:hypothetical protein